MDRNDSGQNNSVEIKSAESKEFSQSSGVINCFEWVESIVTALIIVVVIFTFLFRIVTVSGDSMLPNLKDSYRLILSSFVYLPKQGDIVVISHTAGLNEPIIKRIIALPGQKIDFDKSTGTVLVDGKSLNESAYIQNGITQIPMGTIENPTLTFPQTVPAGHVFVLGDNRPISEDSRYVRVGMIDEKSIIGKAELIIFPFNHIGKIG